MVKSTQRDDEDELEQPQVEALRARVHRMSDTVQKAVMDIALAQNDIKNVKDNVTLMASKEQLTAAIQLQTVRLDTMNTSIKSIEAGVKWVVMLVLGAVILAVLGLVLVKERVI